MLLCCKFYMEINHLLLLQLFFALIDIAVAQNLQCFIESVSLTWNIVLQMTAFSTTSTNLPVAHLKSVIETEHVHTMIYEFIPNRRGTVHILHVCHTVSILCQSISCLFRRNTTDKNMEIAKFVHSVRKLILFALNALHFNHSHYDKILYFVHIHSESRDFFSRLIFIKFQHHLLVET